ncbi:MAG: DUF294 nucleotidyltransferase-like domain-containing protein [Acetobacterales bacterium]
MSTWRRTHSQTELFSLRVGAVMGSAPYVVRPDMAVAWVVRGMAAAGVTSALVVDEARRAVGIVTEQDVVRRIAAGGADTVPVELAMSTPVTTVSVDERLFRAIGRMRRDGLRHMPVVSAAGEPVGVLQLHDALAAALQRPMQRIDALTHSATLDGMTRTKEAQAAVAADLIADNMPAPEVQLLLTGINADIHRRVMDLCVAGMADAGHGAPPVSFEVIVMGSGGRGESFLFPDQDNGFVLDDYPDERHDGIDSWFVALAERYTAALAATGFALCRGNVMATNPLWRKTLPQWHRQIDRWVEIHHGQVLRHAGILADCAVVWGEGARTDALRGHFLARASHGPFARELYLLNERQEVAVGWFGRLRPDPERPGRREANLKHAGIMPLVEAVRVLSIRDSIADTGTVDRLAALQACGALSAVEHADLGVALGHMSALLLRRQLEDFAAGREVGNHVPIRELAARDRRMLVESFRVVQALRAKARTLLTGQIL